MSSMQIDQDRPESRWAERRQVAVALRVAMFLLPVATSVLFVSIATRFIPRPTGLLYGGLWWVGLTAASTGVLVVAERALRKFLPLVALFRRLADVQVTLTDSGGSANGGTSTSPTRTFRITVT